MGNSVYDSESVLSIMKDLEDKKDDIKRKFKVAFSSEDFSVFFDSLYERVKDKFRHITKLSEELEKLKVEIPELEKKKQEINDEIAEVNEKLSRLYSSIE